MTYRFADVPHVLNRQRFPFDIAKFSQAEMTNQSLLKRTSNIHAQVSVLNRCFCRFDIGAVEQQQFGVVGPR